MLQLMVKLITNFIHLSLFHALYWVRKIYFFNTSTKILKVLNLLKSTEREDLWPLWYFQLSPPLIQGIKWIEPVSFISDHIIRTKMQFLMWYFHSIHVQTQTTECKTKNMMIRIIMWQQNFQNRFVASLEYDTTFNLFP